MTSVSTQILRKTQNNFRLVAQFHKMHRIHLYKKCGCHTTALELENNGYDVLQRTKINQIMLPFDRNNIRYFMKSDEMTLSEKVSAATTEQIDDMFTKLMHRNKDKDLLLLISVCQGQKKIPSETTFKSVLLSYANKGKVEIVNKLSEYCKKVNIRLFTKSGEFLHYLAKAECMRGNSDKGLALLIDCYEKNEIMRSIYRVMFKELIQDAVMNRSEASLVIFKKNILELSENWNENYPLIFFWHSCWSSTWFSDQSIADSLFEASEPLREIVKEKCNVFAMHVLKHEYNEDAVVRLLQTLLKYKMMPEYVKVLQVLFHHKMQNRDLRGCREIIHNCKVLGVSLPAHQQGNYIRMLINEGHTKGEPTKPTPFNFKFKF